MKNNSSWTRRSLMASAGLGIGLPFVGGLAAQVEGVEERDQPEAKPHFAGAVVKKESPCVGFPIYPQATLLDFAGATQVFAFSGWKPIWIAEQKGAITTSEGISVNADYSFDDHPPIDILFVPGGGPDGVVASMFNPAYQAFLKKVAAKASWSGSVCVGAFIIAAAGLLDECEATTYWSQLPNLELLGKARRIKVAPGYPRSVIDLARRRFTGGGVSSSIDLALELVALTSGIWAMETGQLSIQYAPDPPIRAGDPSQAPPEVTKQVRCEQAKTFVEPITTAVERLLHTS